MRIVDVAQDKKDLLNLCREDWSEEAAEPGRKRREWLDRQEKPGLRAEIRRTIAKRMRARP